MPPGWHSHPQLCPGWVHESDVPSRHHRERGWSTELWMSKREAKLEGKREVEDVCVTATSNLQEWQWVGWIAQNSTFWPDRPRTTQYMKQSLWWSISPLCSSCSIPPKCRNGLCKDCARKYYFKSIDVGEEKAYGLTYAYCSSQAPRYAFLLFVLIWQTIQNTSAEVQVCLMHCKTVRYRLWPCLPAPVERKVGEAVL